MRITDECLACGSCAAECPSQAIKEGDIYAIDQDDGKYEIGDECVECGACVDACPVGAIVED